MKILVIADVESPYYWDFYSEDKLKGIDLIISCGDLNPNYLSFLTTFNPFPCSCFVCTRESRWMLQGYPS